MEIIPRYRFDALVADALDDLPDELLPVLERELALLHEHWVLLRCLS